MSIIAALLMGDMYLIQRLKKGQMIKVLNLASGPHVQCGVPAPILIHITESVCYTE